MSVTVNNTTASLSGKTLLKAEDTQTVTGLKTFDLGAAAPMAVVAGAAKVTNLDADKLDGQEGAYYQDPANLSAVVPIAKGGTGAATAAANLAFIGPASGGAAAPSFRALVAADVATEQVYSSTGAQNDVAPSAGARVVILCTGAAPAITGFTGGAAGRQLLLVCKGTTLKVSDQTGSTAANQIICESTQGQIVGVNGQILLTYDATNSRWLAQLLSPGAPIAFTPTLGGSGGQSGQAYTTQLGRYQQHGRSVTAWVNLVMSTLGTITTNAQIQSLPLTSQNTTGLISTFSLSTWAALATNITWIGGILDANATAISLKYTDAAIGAGTPNNVLQANLGNTSQLVGSITYPIG